MNASTLAHRGQTGFSLLEVMVALFVLSIGLLGLAALQTTSLKFNTDSYTRTQATMLAYDIIDRIRANPAGLAALDYHAPSEADVNAKLTAYNACSGSACNCDTSVCSSANMAIYDLGKWYENQDRWLAGTTENRSTIEVNGTQVTVTLRWKERDVEKEQRWVTEL